MGWNEQKEQMRGSVHSQFAFPALFYDGVAAVPVDCNVRLHFKVKKFGDMDREGYATTIEDVNAIIIDALELPATAEKNRIYIPKLLRTFRLEVLVPNNDQKRFLKWEVTEVANPV